MVLHIQILELHIVNPQLIMWKIHDVEHVDFKILLKYCNGVLKIFINLNILKELFNEINIEKIIELIKSRIDLIYKAISNPLYTNLHELTVDLACAFGMAKGSKYITHVESNEKEVELIELKII